MRATPTDGDPLAFYLIRSWERLGYGCLLFPWPVCFLDAGGGGE
jgi:hypothetical protein